MSLEAAYIVPHPPLAVPEVGRGEENGIADTIRGYEYVASRIAEIAPDDIIIISPHTAYFADWIYIAGGNDASGSLSQFRAPQVQIKLAYDTELRSKIERLAKDAGVPAGSVDQGGKPLDHGMMVPLYYIDKEYSTDKYEAVSIGGSALPREKLLEFGKCLADATNAIDRKCVLLVSGDLSHKLKEDGPYGFDPAGPDFDEAFVKVVQSHDPTGFANLDNKMCEDAAECGLSGFIMMAGAIDEASTISGKSFTSELISHEGPFGVGYGVAVYEREDVAERISDCTDKSEDYCNDADPLVALAVATINQYVENKTIPETPELPPDEPDRAGCFVSIHVASTGDLRGCIGTIEPTQPTLADEIIANAISASTRDPRFHPISKSELNDLRVNVDVLFEPEPATVDMLDPKRYGVIVTLGMRRGLLLPDLEGVDTVSEQLSIACMKAGIPRDIDPSRLEIERFEVIRHE